jgi:CsoR family transcriptional regulator, copper-sensing transcriptional repressor
MPTTHRPTTTSDAATDRARPTARGAATRAPIPADGPQAEAAAVAAFRHSYSRDRAQLLRRLARMEGQVRGISRMIEREEYCIDILQQTSALRAAVDAVSLLVMEDHVAGCLATAVSTGDATAYTEEVMEVVRRSLGRPARSSRSASD